jgi:hypothetical protein
LHFNQMSSQFTSFFEEALAVNDKQREEQIEREALASRHRPDERPPNDPPRPAGSGGGGVHAAGTPDGGSAVGGLGGTNVGDGAPENADLEAAMGSSDFDVALAEQDCPPYSGRAGGAVGGTPAEKRAEGGTIDGGYEPGDTGRDGTIGIDPMRKPR